jgi:hypothetical protein
VGAFGSVRVLPIGKVFDLSDLFLQHCADRRDRNVLIGRLNYYLNGRRRGKLNLPSRFQKLEDALRNETRGVIRQMMYTVKPEASADHRAPSSVVSAVRAIAPGHVWTSTNLVRTMVNRVDTHRFDKKRWPRGSRSAWPSTPSISEMVAMARCGYTTSGLKKVNIGRSDHMKPRHVQEDLAVATRIVSNNIIGIRDCITIPAPFRHWFRAHSGILFLVVRYNLPAGLVRYLIGQWIKNPFSLWLSVNCRFKQYLKLLDAPKWVVGDPCNWFYQLNGRLEPRRGSKTLEEDLILRFGLLPLDQRESPVGWEPQPRQKLT